MTRTGTAIKKAVLTALAQSSDKVLSAIAEALLPAAETPLPSNDHLACRDAIERISAIAEHLTASNLPTARIIGALVSIDTAIAARGIAAIPWATHLAPLAAERISHAEKTSWQAKWTRFAAERTPIFRLDERTVVAATIGLSDPEGLSRVADRISAEVLRKRPRRVILVCEAAGTADPNAQVWQTLANELKAEGIQLVFRELAT
ncbi:MAG: hypothetical protein QNJ97_06575 [Myxococcota bacterium]|nr:hypothetical protein [Myxococcota bacterium]